MFEETVEARGKCQQKTTISRQAESILKSMAQGHLKIKGKERREKVCAKKVSRNIML